MSTPKKVFYMPGEEATEETKQKAREFAEQREAEKKELLIKTKEASPSVDFMNVNFEPFEDRVLVYPDPVETVTKGGIYKPEEVTNKIKPVNGTVVRVGPGKNGGSGNITLTVIPPIQVNTLPIQPGDRVCYGNYAGTEFVINGVKYLIMRFADIFGKI